VTTEPFTRINETDLELLNIGLAALEPREADGDAVWLRSFEDGRQWIIESDAGRYFFQVNEYTAVPDEFGFIPISDRVRRFCDVAGLDSYELSIADGTTLVARGGALSAAIDFVAVDNEPPTPWSLDETACIVVPAKAFRDLLGAARTLPSGVRETELPVPPMWLQISDDSFGLHVDWTDFGVSKATYRAQAEHQSGRALVALPHRLLENALRTAPLWNDLEDEPAALTIRVGRADGERQAVTLETDSWSLLLWLADPLLERWGAAVEAALHSGRGVNVIDRADTEWVVSAHHQEMRVVLHHGHPDVARVSLPLLSNAEESIELLRELSQLNAASSGVRYWFLDDVVWAASDVPALAIDTQLVTAIEQLATAASIYRPMIATLAVGVCD
jgi:hypothetical protein